MNPTRPLPFHSSHSRRAARRPRSETDWPATVALCLLSAFFLYPFLWMLVGSSKSNLEIFHPLDFWPERWDLSPMHRLLEGEWFPFFAVLANSILAALLQAAGSVILASLAGYAFARHSFRGRNALFILAVTVIVLPPQAMVISLFTWLTRLGFIDHLAGVILPGMVSGLAILYFTQVFRQVPDGLVDTARVEGASEFRVFWTLLPLIRTALISFGLIQFILAWHQHLIPLLVLQSQRHQTLPLALAALYGSSLRFPYAVLMAGSLWAVLPTIILFALLYRRLKTSLSELLLH